MLYTMINFALLTYFHKLIGYVISKEYRLKENNIDFKKGFIYYTQLLCDNALLVPWGPQVALS